MPQLHREPNWRAQSAEPAHPRLGSSVALAFGSVLGLLTAYELIEARWLKGLGPRRLESYGHLVGLVGALLAALISAWLVLRGSPSLFGGAASAADDVPVGAGEISASRAGRDAHFAEWFILMRWLAALVATLLVFVAIAVMGYLSPALWSPLAMAIGALVLLNIGYTWLLRLGGPAGPLLRAQAYGDLVILTTLLHYSGGIENPLTSLMIFHVIIAGIILERKQCYFVAGAAAVLFAGLAFGELSGVLSHYTLGIVPHAELGGVVQHDAFDQQYVVGRVALQAGILLLTAHFATSVVGELRRGEREQRRIEARAQRAEKLAAIGELAGRVAHEVNNPVAIISAKTRLLLSNHRVELSTHTVTELGKITELADRIASIAQGLLAYCHPSTNRAELQSLRPIVRRALAIVEPSARAAGVEIQERIPDELPLVRVNPGEMEQVFLNLFLNSLDAMPDGGALSIIGYEEEVGAGGTPVCVTVADTGCGMPPEIRERIFEPFNTTKPEGKGTGLGLSICLGLMRSNGGTIEVDSHPGAGTRVTLRLPAASELAAPTSARAVRHVGVA
ncbi:MAG TPA: ATP-binding protein [Gemmatimonadaceae bacterium]|nr:ATP-binding protein [Gemmatimonadaceae bacterium]